MMQRLMVKLLLLLLIVKLTPILQSIDSVTRALADICSKKKWIIVLNY